MNTINYRLSSLSFDGAGALLATLSYMKNWSSIGGISGTLASGIQAFAVAAVGDRLARFVLTDEAQKATPNLKKGISAAVIEEGIYSGVLLTQNKWCIIPRFCASFTTGMTAARALVAKVEKPSEGFTQDTKIGFVWAVAREAILLSLPLTYSIPLLLAGDSAVFGLAEVCPVKDSPDLPKFSPAWAYKSLSAAFFRSVANTVASTRGFGASLSQHLLYNVSRSLP